MPFGDEARQEPGTIAASVLPGSAGAEIERSLPAPVRDEAGRFLKGTPSANPGGRPVGVSGLKEAAREHTAAALALLVEAVGDRRAKLSDRITAATAILDRGWGKPTTTVEAQVETIDHGTAHMRALLEMSQERRNHRAARADKPGPPTIEHDPA